MNKFNFNKLTPFKWFVLENFPFIEADFDALTEWQLFCKLGKEINKIINSENTLGTQMENVTNAFIDLQNYVNNYFDNLDVQDEINNKLNEMAQDGTLQEIIAEYLNTKSLLGFDNVSDMINSENLIEGSYAETFGFHNINDGGSKKYKIIKEQNAQNVNGRTKINLLHDDLYAISLNDKINVREYGAKGDGITDDTEAIQFCIDNFPHRNIYIPNGEYLISSPLKVKMGIEYQINLILEDNAIIKTNTEINALLEIANDTLGTYNRYSPYGKMLVQGGVWDATNTTYAIYTTSNRKFTIFKDLYILNVANYGIYIDRGTVGSSSSDARLFNISISGNGADINPNAVGLYLYGTDNEIDVLRIQRIKKAMYLHSGGDLISNVHLTSSYSKDNVTAEEYNNTIGIECDGGGTYIFSNLFVDTYAQSILISSNSVSVFIYNFYTVFWKQDESYTTSIIKLNQYPLKFIINGANIQPPIQGIKKGIDIDNLTSQYWEYFNTHNKIKILNLQTYNGMFDDIDNIKCLQVRNEDSYLPVENPWTVNMQRNAYYQVAVLRAGTYDIDFSMGNDQLIRVILNVNTNGNITIENIKSNSHANKYNLALINGNTDSKGKFYCGLAVMSTANDTFLNPCITRITSRFSNQIYLSKNVSTPLTNPTIIASASFNP